MTGNSMFSRNCNIDPAECARPFEENYEKMVVLIRGVGASGKSTLANLMLNEDFYYLSMNLAMIDPESGIRVILNFLNEYQDQAILNIHVLSFIVVEECMEEFMNFFFKKYIIENPYENIILDGYLYTYPEAYALLREKCRVYGYRLWDAKRVV